MEASALTWQHPTARDWYYLATDPEARKWRGPFPHPEAMRRDMRKQLGCEPFETQTTVVPSFMRKDAA